MSDLIQPVAGMTGEMHFTESTVLFADNDLGSGAITEMETCPNLDDPARRFSWLVRLNWLDWNHVVFEEIEGV